MKCPNCQETDHASDAVFCHMCGNRLVKSNNTAIIAITGLIILAIIVGIVLFMSNNKQIVYDDKKPISTENNYELHIRNVIQAFCEAIENNDFGRLENAYANHVNRYHGTYNLSKNEVVESYKKYDKKFGVYSKQISVRWNTLQVWKNMNGGYSVIYVEDYHINRNDKSKYSNFVIEKHLEFDDNYKIISDYDIQLNKK